MENNNFKASETRTDESSSQGTQAAESVPSDWTDEKHHLFLESMEASFVSQLYSSSKHSVGSCALGENSSHPKSPGQSNCNAHSRSHFGQFKVLRHGSWKNMNFEQTEPRPRVLNESQALSRNPWIHHFRAAPKHKNAAPSKSQAINSRGRNLLLSVSNNNSRPMARRACNSHLSQQYMISSNTEVSDQNFVDEDNKVEKENSVCDAKRVKTPETITNASSNDQVVPSSKVHEGNDVNEKSITNNK